MALLFVYGTLRYDSDMAMACFLRSQSDWLGAAALSGVLYDLGAYPGAVYVPEAATQVRGDLFRLHRSEWMLERLDVYEGIDPTNPTPQDEYIRKRIPVLHRGEPQMSWVYLYQLPTSGLRVIPLGDYLKWIFQ
ncbi:MAG TPA: gamma-glutamylcyclotransferase [Saprospiraceae bacterium]|nr:gamma-glutamylcyclotransferase [Saprospiraceae bacterium]HMP12497.1 gamma-glutamylcyclotransferase [Saprospiraceae bacterium]